jgi:hypothetical protein
MLDFAYVCPIEAYDLATPRLIAQDLRRVISTVFRCSRLRLLDCPLYRLLFSVASIWPRTTSTTVTATILSAASTIKSTTKIITLRPHDSRSPRRNRNVQTPKLPRHRLPLPQHINRPIPLHIRISLTTTIPPPRVVLPRL